jgi:RHS repeat-associated protein
VQQDENNQTVKTLNFTYDAFGRRASNTEDGAPQKYLYDGDDIIAILDDQNKVIATITHDESIDRPLSITNANGTFYYHRDHQGSIIALTDSSGQVVESFTYDNHYGTIVDHTKTIETNNPYAYTGRELDTDELYYYRARYYDPQIERFLGEDPIGFDSRDFNFYRYVANSPMNLNDPTGLCNGFQWLFSPIDCLKEYVDSGGCPDYVDENLTGQQCDKVRDERRAECNKLVGTLGAKSCFDKAMQEWYLCNGTVVNR